MLHKIESLTSIGKFKGYSATGDVALKKLTLFYGDNGGGKTTLTSILRSLTQNNPNIIQRRRSVGTTDHQHALLVQRTSTGDTRHTFRNGNWSTPFNNIEIFDIHFVNENIYSGFDFKDDQRKQLHQFVIGAQGVAIQQQIEENKVNKAASRVAQETIEGNILREVGNNLTPELLNSFISITAPQAVNIDTHIQNATTALASANANAVIRTLRPLDKLTSITTSVNFADLSTDLQMTSDTIQNEALRTLFQSHCQELSENGITSPEQWLQRGFSYISTKLAAGQTTEGTAISCPFCKQAVDTNVDLITAYTMQFNTAFNAFVSRLTNYHTQLRGLNLDVVIQALNNRNSSNHASLTSWSAHVPPLTQQPNFDVLSDEANIRQQLQLAITSLQEKLRNPTLPVTSISVTTLETFLQQANTRIVSYNVTVDSYNAAITTFVSGIQTVPQAQTELERLSRIKKRFEPDIVTLCQQLQTERQALRNLNTTYTQLIQQQQATATTFFTTYNTRINHYLEVVFRTLFKIEDVINIPPQGRATQSKIGYRLTIAGEDISFDHAQNLNAKDCLSEGDKSTIALAFFLAKLDIDPGLADKILVFDDPLSSFDTNRRMHTVHLIKNLLTRIKQAIVLSHSEIFLHEISKGTAAAEKKTLRIFENYTTRASGIEPLALESMVEIDYFKNIKQLEHFLQNPDITRKDVILGTLRNVLESHLRFKFYRQLASIAANDQTFGTIITTLVSQNVPFRDTPNRSAIVQSLRLINGISCKPHHGEPIPDYGILGVNPNSITSTELAQFINETFDLIDHRL